MIYANLFYNNPKAKRITMPLFCPNTSGIRWCKRQPTYCCTIFVCKFYLCRWIPPNLTINITRLTEQQYERYLYAKALGQLFLNICMIFYPYGRILKNQNFEFFCSCAHLLVWYWMKTIKLSCPLANIRIYFSMVKKNTKILCISF